MQKEQPPKDDNYYSISYQTLWKAIIRPPRHEYKNDELGNPYFKYRNHIYFRYFLSCTQIQKTHFLL